MLCTACSSVARGQNNQLQRTHAVTMWRHDVLGCLCQHAQLPLTSGTRHVMMTQQGILIANMPTHVQ